MPVFIISDYVIILFLIHGLQKSMQHKWVKKLYQKKNKDRKENKMNPELRSVHKNIFTRDKPGHNSGLTHSISKRKEGDQSIYLCYLQGYKIKTNQLVRRDSNSSGTETQEIFFSWPW